MAHTQIHLTTVPPTVRSGEHAWAGHNLMVDTARELVGLTARMPWQGDSTVVHITSAHRVRDDVWNTLLKTLEEPPPFVHFHLYAPSLDAIPRTIRSRSHVNRGIVRERQPEDASRLVRMIETGDALAIVREGDRHTELGATVTALQDLMSYGVTTGRLGTAMMADYYLKLLTSGANPRVVMKACLLSLAIRHKQAKKAQAHAA